MNPSLTAAAMANELIKKARNMQTFRIMRQLDDADIIFSAGVVPFDVKINKDGRMTATVHAMTLEDANAQVDAWIEKLEQGDDDDWHA
jgi:hypothetical protein